MILRLALLQLAPTGSLEGQLQKGMEACRRAREMGADIALFPEMWSAGYDIPRDLDRLRAAAVEAEGEFVSAFGCLARELDMAVAVTFLERFDPLPRNSVAVFDRYGVRRLLYAKVHTCDFGDEARLTPGEDFYTAVLETPAGSVRTGAMICYDREFPESARLLMLKGAELILTPNACPMEINRLSQLRGRAFENMTAIATANYPAQQPDCNGRSTVFDGVAYLPGAPGSRDTCILEAGEEEGVYLARLDMDMLRDYRRREVHGNSYRRPEKYGLLTDRKIEEPFLRPDRRAGSRGG